MRLFIKVRRTLIDTYAYWQLLGRAKVSQNYWVGIVEDHDTETLQQAKRLHASVYLARDYITNDDIRDGIMHERADPYQNHASYFVVKKQGRVIATARQIIHIDGRAHHDIFPTLKETAVHERSRRHIVKLPVERIVEISALVKQPGESSIVPLVLYRAMWHHSLSRHSLWIMACDMRVYDRLKVLFGPAVRVIGKKTYYMGSYVMPVMLEPHGGLITLIKHAHVSLPVRRVINRHVLRFFVTECPDDALTKIDRLKLEKALPEPRHLGFFGRAWIIGVMLYAVSRSVLVGLTMNEYGISPLLFFAIDIATAAPYAFGQVMFIKAARLRKIKDALLWSLLVVVMFAAPYVYLVSVGKDLPGIVYGAVAVWCAAFALFAVYDVVNRMKIGDLQRKSSQS